MNPAPYAKSEATRQRLVETTAKLLRSRGYAASGVSEIVAESGIPKGSLYHHFPGGKEELAAAAVRHAGTTILAALRELEVRSGSPIRAMQAFCDYYVVQLETSAFTRGCPLATVALEIAANVDVVHGACADAFRDITELFAAALRRDGVPESLAHERALFVVAAIEGALLLAKATRDTAPIRIVRDRLSDLLGEAVASGSKTLAQGAAS
jgi:TetR/AcrR family transcriptional repressor of lmrAB and yxaGH operons